jgi:hypothetical protein
VKSDTKLEGWLVGAEGDKQFTPRARNIDPLSGPCSLALGCSIALLEMTGVYYESFQTPNNHQFLSPFASLMVSESMCPALAIFWPCSYIEKS